MKTPIKVSIKKKRIVGTLSRMQSRVSITFNCIFWGEDQRSIFLQKGNIIFLTFTRVYRKYHISMYFLRKINFYFPSKEKTIFSGKKNTIFLDNTRKIIFQCNFFWKDHLFGTFEENMIF